MRVDELFEAGSPLAARLSRRGPFASDAELIAAARQELASMSDAEKVATLNAHPRIGASPSEMSRRSREEQGDEQVGDLDRLNDEYERRFGFRFVVFVNRRPRSEIANILRDRLEGTREAEMETGMAAIVDIAEDRLRHP